MAKDLSMEVKYIGKGLYALYVSGDLKMQGTFDECVNLYERDYEAKTI